MYAHVTWDTLRATVSMKGRTMQAIIWFIMCSIQLLHACSGLSDEDDIFAHVTPGAVCEHFLAEKTMEDRQAGVLHSFLPAKGL